MEEDERLLPMLCGLSKRYIGSDYNVKKSSVGQVTADMIDMVSSQLFSSESRMFVFHSTFFSKLSRHFYESSLYQASLKVS